MAFRCPHCGAQLDATLFEFGRKVKCECGRVIAAGHVLREEPPPGRSRGDRPREETEGKE